MKFGNNVLSKTEIPYEASFWMALVWKMQIMQNVLTRVAYRKHTNIAAQSIALAANRLLYLLWMNRCIQYITILYLLWMNRCPMIVMYKAFNNLGLDCLQEHLSQQLANSIDLQIKSFWLFCHFPTYIWCQPEAEPFFFFSCLAFGIPFLLGTTGIVPQNIKIPLWYFGACSKLAYLIK